VLLTIIDPSDNGRKATAEAMRRETILERVLAVIMTNFLSEVHLHA
jgi:hypothetical protein